MGEHYTVEQLVNDGPRYAMAFLLKSLSHGEPFLTYGRIAGHLEPRMEIPKIFSTQIGHVVGSMQDKIYMVDPAAPLLNALATRQNGIPGEGVASYIDEKYRNGNKKKWGDLSIKKKLKIVEQIRQDVRSYSKWDDIYKELFGEPATENYPEEEIKEGAGTGYGGGESGAHKALKYWVAENPSKIGVPEGFDRVIIEAPLLSGDVVDVMFFDGNSFYPVEVKSKISTDDDLRRGLYQCVKYRAVQEAQELPVKAVVTSILVTERKLSGELKELQKRLGILHMEVSVN